MKGLAGAMVVAGTLGIAAYAQAAVPEVSLDRDQPTAGQSMGDLGQLHNDITRGKGTNVQLDIQEEVRPELKLPDTLKIKVNGFKITGQTIVPDGKLQAMLAGSKGKLLSFADLQKQADMLTDYYKRQGYMVARVYLPVQKITDGIVEYSVSVGKFDEIKLNNYTTIHMDALHREMSFLKKGDYIRKEAIERAVWLLSDLAGADAKVTISSGTQGGTSNLVIDINPHTGKTGLLTLDNYGNRYTGYNEAGVSYDLLNPVNEGDHLALNATTTSNGLFNTSMNYTLPVLRDGLTFNAGFSYLHYTLGDVYDYLDAYGTARVYHLGFDYAIQRSQRHNLYTGLRLEHSKLNDSYGRYDLDYGDKHGNAGVLSLYGDEQDVKGATFWRLDYKLGNIGFDNEATRTFFGSSGTEGSYSKLSGNILRRQSMNSRLYLLLSARGQLASRNLDSSERLSLGGFSGVRAYPQGEASGDVGYTARAELRWLLPLKKQDQSLQLAVYLDNGRVQSTKNSDTHRMLSSAGLGLVWSRKDDWFLRTDYAWKLGARGENPTADTSHCSGHFWIQGGLYF